MRLLAGAAFLALVTVTILAALLVTWSRGDRLAASSPPAATTLTEPVEQRELTSVVVARGTITAPDNVNVSCTPTSASAGAGVTVLTRPPKLGATLREGELLAAVNGRPVLLFSGKTPTFRDIRPGTTGDDVRQLQSGLRNAGYRITDAKGVFGASTQAAVAKLYADKGFTAPDTGAESRSRLDAAHSALDEAAGAVKDAQAELTKAARRPPASEILSAELAVEEAEAAAAKATGNGTRAKLLRAQAHAGAGGS